MNRQYISKRILMESEEQTIKHSTSTQYKQGAFPLWSKAIKFCFSRGKILKLISEFWSWHELFPPLKGARGMFLGVIPGYVGKYQLDIPPPPFKGGEHPANAENLSKNFYIQKLDKLEHNSPSLWRRLGGGIILMLLLLLYSSCEDEITPTLEEAPAVIVIDAWINDKPEPQIIKVMSTQEYFDNSLPQGVSGATVQIVDENLKVYDFEEQASGEYVWTPQEGETFGQVELNFVLNVEVNAVLYNSVSKMNGVPPVDSLSFEFEEEDGPFPEGYIAEFWARDLAGEGDTYWIKTWKNGQLLNKPSEINIAFDAGFSAGGSIDGLIFIPPIRFGINTFEDDENGDILPAYVPGDSVYVELYSITNEAFYFLSEVAFQTDRPGGFAELFATPLSNVATNIIPSDENVEVVGFFNVSAVSGNGKRLIE